MEDFVTLDELEEDDDEEDGESETIGTWLFTPEQNKLLLNWNWTLKI